MKHWIWIQRMNGVVYAALCENACSDAELLEELKALAVDGPVERIFAESVTVGRPL